MNNVSSWEANEVEVDDAFEDVDNVTRVSKHDPTNIEEVTTELRVSFPIWSHVVVVYFFIEDVHLNAMNVSWDNVKANDNVIVIYIHSGWLA